MASRWVANGKAAKGASIWLALAGLLFALTVARPAPSDDLRVLHLENEIRRLQRELDVQARRIDQLERAARNAALPGARTAASERMDSSPAWLVSTNWDRLRLGMKVTDVVALLGRPTSVRTDANGKVDSLWYAMQLGPAAVLTGNVQLSASGVAKINKPELR
jgi:hypothetical protein